MSHKIFQVLSKSIEIETTCNETVQFSQVCQDVSLSSVLSDLSALVSIFLSNARHCRSCSGESGVQTQFRRAEP